jgi:hypothetical protein
MTDHDPLAEAHAAAHEADRLAQESDLAPFFTDRESGIVAAMHGVLDAAGYEVRPKLTAERLAAWLRHLPGCPRNDARLRKMRGYADECDCGLDAALAAAP